VSELLLAASDFSRRGDWLNVHLHIDWSRVHLPPAPKRRPAQPVLYRRAAGCRLRLSLVRNAGRFDPGAEERFEQAWARLGVELNTTRQSGT
jgi:hypothetical protein